MKKFIITSAAVLAIVVVVGYGVYRYMNPPPEDFYTYYLEQDTVPEGKTAVFLIGLHTPEDNEPTWWYNIVQHSVHANQPWPIQMMSLADNGIALVDPQRYYAREEYVPTRLVDRFGSEYDMDKEPYIEKYRQGLVQWQPPRESIHLDTGYWLYTGQQDGIPSGVGKRINLATHWYYDGGIKQGKVPADYQSWRIYDIAFAKLKQNYPDVLYEVAGTLDPYLWKKKIYDFVDGGVETLVLTSPMVMYSDYEDFHNGFGHSIGIVRQWEAENGRKVKVIIAPPMGYQQAMQDGYLLILKDKLDSLPAGVSVKMVWSVHGMPWLAVPQESWLKMSPPYIEAMQRQAEELLEQYNFSRTEVVIGQDHFADHYWDPEGVYLSTHKAYMDGVADGYDHVLSIPIEFYNEIDYPNWDKPYTAHYEIDGTQIDYLGVPTGDRYRPYVAQALFDSIDTVLARRE